MESFWDISSKSITVILQCLIQNGEFISSPQLELMNYCLMFDKVVSSKDQGGWGEGKGNEFLFCF